MATNGKAAYHGSATHPARVLRNVDAIFMGQPTGSHANAVSATTRGGSYGVVGDGDLLVTTTGALGYSVAPGRVGGPGTFAAYQGWYGGYNDAAVTGSFGARHATLTRIDLVCYRVRDTDEDATGSEDDGIVIVAGTAGSGVPSTPSSLGTLVVLAEVSISSSAVNSALVFTDRRQKLSALGALIICTSSSRPTVARTSQEIYETDTGTLQINVSATSTPSWSTLIEPAQSWSPSVSQPGVIAGTVTRGWYQRSRGVWLGQFTWVASAAGTAATQIVFSLPFTLANSNDVGGSFVFADVGASNYAGTVQGASTTTAMMVRDGGGTSVGLDPNFAIAAGDALRVNVQGLY